MPTWQSPQKYHPLRPAFLTLHLLRLQIQLLVRVDIVTYVLRNVRVRRTNVINQVPCRRLHLSHLLQNLLVLALVPFVTYELLYLQLVLSPLLPSLPLPNLVAFYKRMLDMLVPNVTSLTKLELLAQQTLMHVFHHFIQPATTAFVPVAVFNDLLLLVLHLLMFQLLKNPRLKLLTTHRARDLTFFVLLVRYPHPQTLQMIIVPASHLAVSQTHRLAHLLLADRTY
jgi:hypothetical protein